MRPSKHLKNGFGEIFFQAEVNNLLFFHIHESGKLKTTSAHHIPYKNQPILMARGNSKNTLFILIVNNLHKAPYTKTSRQIDENADYVEKTRKFHITRF